MRLPIASISGLWPCTFRGLAEQILSVQTLSAKHPRVENPPMVVLPQSYSPSKHSPQPQSPNLDHVNLNYQNSLLKRHQLVANDMEIAENGLLPWRPETRTITLSGQIETENLRTHAGTAQSTKLPSVR